MQGGGGPGGFGFGDVGDIFGDILQIFSVVAAVAVGNSSLTVGQI